jgi:hypothetical protein
MQYITEQTLEDLDIKLDPEAKQQLLEHFNETLQTRIGAEITESLNDDQLEELLTLQQDGDEAKIAQWLRQNVPDLNDIVQDEVDILIGELADSTNQISE